MSLKETINNSSEILSLRDKAKNQLLEIRTVEDGISYLNKLKSIDVWVKAEKKDAELQNIVAEQKLRTQRILGELLSESTRKNLGSNQWKLPQETTLSEYGLNKKQSSTFQAIAAIPQDQFESFIQDKKEKVNEAVQELTTAGALRLAKSINYQSNDSEIEITIEDEIIYLKKAIAQNLKEYRIREKLIQKQVAAKLDLKLFTYQSYEEARALLTIDTLIRVKKLYNLRNVEDLLKEKH